jgi:recombination protein RecR
LKLPAALGDLIEALRALPSVGPKSAQRMAFHLLQDSRPAARALARSLDVALEKIGQCQRCRMLADGALCGVCADPARDPAVLCVVETPADVLAVEQAGGYRGRYFVLQGRLSPLDGIGPDELGSEQFLALLSGGLVQEVILATNSTVEGEATAHLFSQLVRQRGVRASRIAHGVPMGGELEYVDGGTLSAAIAGRQSLG